MVQCRSITNVVAKALPVISQTHLIDCTCFQTSNDNNVMTEKDTFMLND